MKKADFNAISTSTIALKRERESSSRLSLDSLTAQGICHTTTTNCHTEAKAEVSKNANAQNHLDISVASLPQYDNKLLCHTEALAEVSQSGFANNAEQNRDSSLNATQFAQNDKHRVSPKTPHKKAKSRKLALSLATASILASATLDFAAAACSWSVDWNHGGDVNKVGYAGKVDCTGVSSNMNQLFQNATGYTQPTYYRNNYWNLSGSTAERTVTATFTTSRWKNPNLTHNYPANQVYEEVNFNGLNASGTDFVMTNKDSPTRLKIASNGSRNVLNSLKIEGSVSDGVTLNNTYIVGNVFGGTESLSIASGNNGVVSSLTITGGSTMGEVKVDGRITNMSIDGGSTLAKLSGTGTITTLNFGNRSGGYGSANIGSYNFNSVNIGTLLLYSAALTIDSDSATWNAGTTAGKNNLEHIYVKNDTSVGIATNSIRITLGSGAMVNQVYNYNKIVTGATVNGVNANHVQGAPGVGIEPTADGRGFLLSADVATSYGSSVYRALALSNLRRQAMTQNILDTMTTKTFHSDRYYNQEVELRLLQYDLSRLTNRSSKFSKTTRKNQSKVDKVREKMAKLTLEQSKGQNLDKGYNNFELIDQLDAIFIPYTGRRDWRFFALPYASNSYVDLGSSTALEYAGGAIFGVQRNLRNAGIFGGYVGYEFVNTDTELVGAQTRVQTHSLQAGLNYFKTFSFTSKTWEGFIRANLRGGVDLPQFSFDTGAYKLRLESNEKASSIPLMYNVGAEFKGGITFYYFKRNSYLSPEVSLSYDMLSTFNTWLNKPTASLGGTSFMPLGAHEYYKGFYWHLPQLGVALRYYKMWGNTFRTNLKAGIKYNMLNKQNATFRIGDSADFENTSAITLPAVYGNLAFDFIWMIKKNHELSFGYDGLFYASTFDKSSTDALNRWFNGVTTTLNFKYAYWFGGTDYVTDKDGNAVSRSIAEGKKSKKSKKSKTKKKSKKSKKKVYYIDG